MPTSCPTRCPTRPTLHGLSYSPTRCYSPTGLHGLSYRCLLAVLLAVLLAWLAYWTTWTILQVFSTVWKHTWQGPTHEHRWPPPAVPSHRRLLGKVYNCHEKLQYLSRSHARVSVTFLSCSKSSRPPGPSRQIKKLRNISSDYLMKTMKSSPPSIEILSERVEAFV